VLVPRSLVDAFVNDRSDGGLDVDRHLQRAIVSQDDTWAERRRLRRRHVTAVQIPEIQAMTSTASDNRRSARLDAHLIKVGIRSRFDQNATLIKLLNRTRKRHIFGVMPTS
jgi:hypothetical protein